MIPVYRPDLSGNESKYVLDCVESSWISSIGSYIDRFEKLFSSYTGIKHSISVSNGTVALHLAFHCLYIGPGDEVIVPTFTYIASVNTIAQTGATPVFVDCSEGDWLLNPDLIIEKISTRTKAICVVHLYGAVANMARIREIADSHNLKIIEDCAESLGSFREGAHVGTFGDIATFSFFGNKTVTTGEGGMVCTSDDVLAAKLRKVKGQGQSLHKRYWHDELGFNYRMTNICAAIGCAQMERISELLHRKQEIYLHYEKSLEASGYEFQNLTHDTVSSYWLVSMLVPSGRDRNSIMAKLNSQGVDCRPTFYCAHQMPMYYENTVFTVSEDISRRGISLPSFPGLTQDEQETVVNAARNALDL